MDIWNPTQGLMFGPHAGFILEPHPISNYNKLQFINVVFEKVDETAWVSLNCFNYVQNQYGRYDVWIRSAMALPYG